MDSLLDLDQIVVDEQDRLKQVDKIRRQISFLYDRKEAVVHLGLSGGGFQRLIDREIERLKELGESE